MSAKYSSLLARRQKYLHPVHKTNYAKPMMVTKGEMQYLYDEENVRYLDLFGGVATVSIGHSHPELTKAVARQTATLTHTSTLFLTESIVDFCETLANKLPNPDDWVVHLVNSGSEANDFAALQARVATKNYVLMSLRHGYHGCTEGSRGLVSVPKWKHSIPPPPGMFISLSIFFFHNHPPFCILFRKEKNVYEITITFSHRNHPCSCPFYLPRTLWHDHGGPAEVH